MPEYKGIEYLRKKLDGVRSRAMLRYDYYEMKNVHQMPSNVIPEKLSARYRQKLGWCTKAVDQLADRLVVRSIENDRMNMQAVFDVNNPDILYSSAIRGALITSCDFIYIFKDETGAPRLQVIDGANATGEIDTTTQLLKEGYAVLSRDERTKRPLIEAYFLPGSTEYIYADGQRFTVFSNAPYPLLVPVVNRPDARREFGHSRISRACMAIQDSAEDVLTRAAVSADFYSWPQKYVLGLSDTADNLDTWRATISAMLRFDKDEDGGTPSVGQFMQQTMTPHIDHFKVYASAFAGETGLTMDDLGFPSDNPSSAEAIKASHETLRVTAAEAQRNFGIGFLNAGYLACCLRDEQPYKREAMYETSVVWAPVVEPDAAMLSSIGDGAIKINQAIPGFFSAAGLEKLTGIKSEG